MKLLLSTVVLAALATSAFAADPTAPIEGQAARQISGYGEIYGGGLWTDPESDEDIWAAGGAARVNLPFAERWNVQGDLTVDAIGAEDNSLRSIGGVVHLNWRDPASYAVGGFAEVKTYGASGPGSDFFPDIWDWRVGPEAQVYFDRVTLYGQAYYGSMELEGAPVDFNLMGIRGVVRYFAQDNLRFDAELGFQRVTIDEVDIDFDTIALALQATYRFAETPWSVFGRYQFEDLSINGADESFQSHKLMVGLRASFGSGTLLDEDRNGATMDTYRPNLVTPSLFVAP
ncbi:hypothetical protein [Aminobacter sp. BE322]|uniref:hypothetical protein n=1 Tax=unclassified Aminobacter TaxID=2644704 RepID=UPI003D1A804A